MSTARLTPAMVAALRLASRDTSGVRYYKGGWYSIPEHCGDYQRAEVKRSAFDVASASTLKALVGRDLLSESHETVPTGVPIVYGFRWTLTDLGRDTLAAIDAEGER